MSPSSPIELVGVTVPIKMIFCLLQTLEWQFEFLPTVLGKLAAATAGNLNTDVGNDVLEQNVHIDAQFPNARDSREIEEALNNLVNMATMRANRK